MCRREEETLFSFHVHIFWSKLSKRGGKSVTKIHFSVSKTSLLNRVPHLNVFSETAVIVCGAQIFVPQKKSMKR